MPFLGLRKRLLMLNVKSWLVIYIPHYLVLAQKLEFYEPFNSVQSNRVMSDDIYLRREPSMRGYVLIGFVTWKS